MQNSINRGYNQNQCGTMDCCVHLGSGPNGNYVGVSAEQVQKRDSRAFLERGDGALHLHLAALRGEGYEVRLETRKKSEGRGLSSAVLLGFSRAAHDVVLCMDADLQHEPEAAGGGVLVERSTKLQTGVHTASHRDRTAIHRRAHPHRRALSLFLQLFSVLFSPSRPPPFRP